MQGVQNAREEKRSRRTVLGSVKAKKSNSECQRVQEAGKET